MGLIPDGIAGERPGCADANKEVAPGLPHHEADKDEEQADGWQHGAAHPEIGVSEIPGKCKSIDVDHTSDDQYNEQVERAAELCNIGFEWINRRDHQEQYEHSQCYKGHHEHSPGPGHIAIRLVIDVPV